MLTKWGAIDKSSILLLQYWNITHLVRHQNIFVDCIILKNQEADTRLANQEADTSLANQETEPKSNSLTNGNSIFVESGKIYLYTN